MRAGQGMVMAGMRVGAIGSMGGGGGLTLGLGVGMAAQTGTRHRAVRRAPVAVESKAHGELVAPTPPMGWNSWDSFGLTVNEQQFRQNMTVLTAQLKDAGWQYVVVDEGWYLENPEVAGARPEALR